MGAVVLNSLFPGMASVRQKEDIFFARGFKESQKGHIGQKGHISHMGQMLSSETVYDLFDLYD